MRQAAYASGTGISLAKVELTADRFTPTGNEIARVGTLQRSYNIEGGDSVDGYTTFVFFVPAIDLPRQAYALWFYTDGNTLAYVSSDGAAGDHVLDVSAADADPNGRVPVIIRIALEDKPGLASFTFTTPTNVALAWSDSTWGMVKRATATQLAAGLAGTLGQTILDTLGVSLKQLIDNFAQKDLPWSDSEARVVKKATSAEITGNSDDVALSVAQVNTLIGQSIPSISFGSALPANSAGTRDDIFILKPPSTGLITPMLSGQSIYNEHAETTGFTYDASTSKFVLVFEDSQNQDRLTALIYSNTLQYESKVVLSQDNIGSITKYSIAATQTHYLVAHIIQGTVYLRAIRKSDKQSTTFTLPSVSASSHRNVSLAWDGSHLFVCDQISGSSAIIRKYTASNNYTTFTLEASGTVSGLADAADTIEGMAADNGKVWLLVNKSSQHDAYVQEYSTALAFNASASFSAPSIVNEAVGLAFLTNNWYILDWNQTLSPNYAASHRYPQTRIGFYRHNGTQWGLELQL